MKELPTGTKSILSRLNGGRILYVALIMVGFLLIMAASKDLSSIQSEDDAARAEYDELRELFYMTGAVSAADKNASNAGLTPAEKAMGQSPYNSTANPDTPVAIPEILQAEPMARIIGINGDFAGWICIEGTGVDYPIVQGKDNERYLNTTFTGNYNPAGAVFMDYRLTRGFNESVCVLYGHNMRDGSMFAQLNKYIEPAFMAEHPFVNITTPEGETLIYRVFDAGLTDMRDTAHDPDTLRSAAQAVAADSPPGGEGRYLILSTCTPGADTEERMLVYALLTK